MQTELAKQMNELASRLPEWEAHDIMSAASAFDSATQRFLNPPHSLSAEQYLAVWVRARRAYVEASSKLSHA